MGCLVLTDDVTQSVVVSVITGVTTGIFVALLFEFIFWLKGRLARRKQISYIRTFLVDQRAIIESITDENAVGVPKELGQCKQFQHALRQLKLIVEARSPNLTNEQRSEILRVVYGELGVLEMFESADKLPPSEFVFEQLESVENIDWLRVKG